MPANPSDDQDIAVSSSPENAESSSGVNNEEFFDVWLIKGIRIFWNSKTKKRQKRYLVSWLGYPWWHDSWEPRENIGNGCKDLIARAERAAAAALGPKPAVGTQWLAPKDWLEMEAKQNPPGPDFQARIDKARKEEDEGREQGNPMNPAFRAVATQNLIDYENYKAERKRHKQEPPAPLVKTQPSVGALATNKEYRRWFRGTRRSTRDQGYFHYSGDDQELAPVPWASTGNDKKRRRSPNSSDASERIPSDFIIEEPFEASDGDIPLAQLSKRKAQAPVPKPKKRKKKKKDTYVGGPPPKKQRLDPLPKPPTPPPDSESSGVEVPLSKQKKPQVIESSSDEYEPLAIQARKNKTQTATPAQVAPPSILNQTTPPLKPNPKATLNPNFARTRSTTLPSTSGLRAQAKRSATGASLVTPAIPSSAVGDRNATQNNPPLSSYLHSHGGGPIVQGGVPWVPVNQAVNRKQYVGSSSKQQGLSLGARARMLGEAPAVGRGRQASRPSNSTAATREPKPRSAFPRSRVTASASQPSESTENDEEDLFGDKELEENAQPADNMDVDMSLNIGTPEPTVVESTTPPPPEPSRTAPAVASKAARLDVEATSFLTDVMAEVAPAWPEHPRPEPQKGPRRIGLYLQSTGPERLCEIYLANISNSSLPGAHLTKWIFIPGENDAIRLDILHPASHASLILPAFEPLQWARLNPWDNDVDTRPLGAVRDWLNESNQFAILQVPNKPTLYLSIFSPRCKPFFDIFPDANPNYQEDNGLVLVLLKRRFIPQRARSRKPSLTPEPLIKLPREVLYQDPDISRGLMLLKLPQSTFEAWQTAWKPFGRPRPFSLFTMETSFYRRVIDGKTWYGDQLPANEHASWRLKHQPETRALLKILEMAQLKPWHVMERTDITFIHNNAWELLKKLPGLSDRLGRPHTQFFAFGPHHALSSDQWGVREVFKRGERAVVTFTARLIAEDGETFKGLIERIHKSPISVAYVTPLTVALVELMVTDVQLYPNNLESLRLLLDAILDSRISLMTAPPYSWKHDDMKKWCEMQFTFGTDESRSQEPIEALASFLDKGAATPPLEYRTYDSILTACAKELETSQEEQPMPWNDVIDAGFRQMGPSPSPRFSPGSAITNKGIPTTALQLEGDVNTFLYSDLRLMQSNHFYQTEYRHFVVVESKDSAVWAKERVADTIQHLTTDEALRLVDPIAQRRTNTV